MAQDMKHRHGRKNDQERPEEFDNILQSEHSIILSVSGNVF
ncbi:hypothetical protein MUY_004048 [Bacillus licheniformis WX-02]|nr:hypothetical protein MUY_004048 [Bacillus licheniformis WX-02]